MTVDQKIQLILAKVEILKIKADAYNWQCSVPPKVRDELEATLREVDQMLQGEEA